VTQKIISEKLLKAIIKYIERAEVTLDGHLGSLRSLKQLEKDGELPELLFKLRSLRDSKD
jgi:hypothetical protein